MGMKKLRIFALVLFFVILLLGVGSTRDILEQDEEIQLTPKACDDCGLGTWNTCDRTECNSIRAGCYFNSGGVFGFRSCIPCSIMTCDKYQSVNDCRADRCGLDFCDCDAENFLRDFSPQTEDDSQSDETVSEGIQTGSCEIIERKKCNPEKVVMGLSSLTNAHGGLVSQNNYDYVLCCGFAGTHTCDNTNKILGLSSVTNAHAEVPYLGVAGQCVNKNYRCIEYLNKKTCPTETCFWSGRYFSYRCMPRALADFETGRCDFLEKETCISHNCKWYMPYVERCWDKREKGSFCFEFNSSGTCPTDVCNWLETSLSNYENDVCYGDLECINWKGEEGICNKRLLACSNLIDLEDCGMQDACIIDGENCIGKYYSSMACENFDETTCNTYSSQCSWKELTPTTDCPTDYSLEMLSLSSETNAHIGGFEDYDVKICCSSKTLEEPDDPEDCELIRAKWSKIQAFEGEEVSLIVKGENCNNVEISFDVKEYYWISHLSKSVDQNPFNVKFKGNTAIGTWTAEYGDDGSTYSFRATIVETGKYKESSVGEDGLLTVTEAPFCGNIFRCLNYQNPNECRQDSCNVSKTSVDEKGLEGVICGLTHDCACYWNVTEDKCSSKWTAYHHVCDNADDCWVFEEDGHCLSDCTCEEGYEPDEEGTCKKIGRICNTTDECWLQGDLCNEETCECQDNTIKDPEKEGSCMIDPNVKLCTTSDECWLVNDLCINCSCVSNTLPDSGGLGFCELDPNITLCDSNVNECWLAGVGSHCLSNCTCEQGHNSNGDGSCGGSGGKKVCNATNDQCWLQGDLCNEETCECQENTIQDSENEGACIEDPNVILCNTSNECWLVNDLCVDCSCVTNTIQDPDNEGSCKLDPSIKLCDKDDECWLVGEGSHCLPTCNCENGYDPNNEGACEKTPPTPKPPTHPDDRPIIGVCYYNESIFDPCGDDGYMSYSWTVRWVWDEDNEYSKAGCLAEIRNGLGDMCVEDTEVQPTTWRYDPYNKDAGTTKSGSCFNGTSIPIPCPAKVQIGFFGIYSLIVTILLISFIYGFLIFKENKTEKNC